MLEYFYDVRKKHGAKINKHFDKRTRYTQLAAIKRLKLDGGQFVEFVHWVEKNNLTFPHDIYYLVNQCDKFKKKAKELFNGQRP